MCYLTKSACFQAERQTPATRARHWNFGAGGRCLECGLFFLENALIK
jgi:hypothetical protein